MLFNQQVQTYRNISYKKPDLIIIDNKKGTWKLTDVANSGNRNVIKKEAEKILKDKYIFRINTANVERHKEYNEY
jgi:DNA modification methylase